MLYSEHSAAYDAKNRYGLPMEMDMKFSSIAKCFHDIDAMNGVVEDDSPQEKPEQTKPKEPAPEPAPKPEATETKEKEEPKKEEPKTVDTDNLSSEHKALMSLMEDSNVTYEDVLAVLVERKKYPEGTEFQSIEPKFCQGYIMQFWPKIVEMINANKSA